MKKVFDIVNKISGVAFVFFFAIMIFTSIRYQDVPIILIARKILFPMMIAIICYLIHRTTHSCLNKYEEVEDIMEDIEDGE